jgi:hypothetical protein
MKPFDDRLPEEQDPQYEELITFLQHANLSTMLVDPQERAHVLSRVRRRLVTSDQETSLNKEMSAPAIRELASPPSRPNAKVDKQHRSRRLVDLFNVLAAVLVVAALIGTSFLVFGPWSLLERERSGTAPPIGPVGAPVVVRTQAHGLEMTMKITPGPYFLSEMLEVDLSLTNHTQTAFQGDICHLYPKLIMIDGEGLHDTILASALATTAYRDQQVGVKLFPYTTNLANALATNPTPTLIPECFPDRINVPKLQPSQTITVQHYVALTSSGHVTLTTRTAFQRAVNGQNGRFTLVPAANPLDGHWPTLQISVSTRLPSDRMLSLHQQNRQVIVDVSAAARGQFLYTYNFECGLGTSVSGSGGEFRTNNKISQPTITLQKPQCGDHYFGSTPSKLLQWTYVIGVPGYTTLSGKYSS